MMGDGYDWLLRPVLCQCCSYESLINGTMDLGDVAILNNALDVKNENEIRLSRAQQRNG